MDNLAIWFANTLGQFVSREIVIFIISMIPILELRGGLLVASLLNVSITTAIPICIVGNIIPIPFILLFIKQIFKWLKKIKFFKRMIERLVRKFDKFVVLTQEDRGYWGELHNIEVIPNAAMFLGDAYSDVSYKRIIAVGRLDYQKSFDRLVEAWAWVQQTNKFSDWQLDIFGQGEWQEMLQRMIEERKLGETAHINRPTSQIGEEYARSSMLVMSSHYEGFPMVMIEAMACGLPVVSFDYKCGPKDIIQDGINGLLVKDGDIEGLANAMMRLMENEEERKAMGRNARQVTETYSEESVMKKWIDLFTSLTGE